MGVEKKGSKRRIREGKDNSHGFNCELRMKTGTDITRKWVFTDASGV